MNTYYVRLTDEMLKCIQPLYMAYVGVIIKVYFAIFEAIVECGINDLESYSEVIQGHRFWYQSKIESTYTYSYLLL